MQTIASHDASKDAATVCFINPDDNKPYKARILAQPFGGRRAPANWGMVATFIQFLACERLSLTVSAFVGDVFRSEPASAETSSFWSFKRIAELVGFPTSDKQGQHPTTALHLLGDQVAIGSTSFCAAERLARVATLRGHIAQALRTNFLTPAAASKLRGKLGFYNALLAGKIGRGMMGPLIARQYWRRRRSLDTTLRRNLLWRYAAPGNLPPHVTPFHFDSSVGARTDAQGLGRVAAVFTGEAKTAVSTHLPLWSTSMVTALPDESPIFIHELCVSILTARLALNWSRDKQRTCLLRVDNQAAVAALVKGSPSSPVGALLASLFWNVAARCATLWWAEYVHAKSNDADAPSRLRTAQRDNICAYQSGHIHSAFSEAFASWESPHREATVFKKEKRT